MKEFYPEGFIGTTYENRKSMSTPAMLYQAQSSSSILEANVIMCDAEHNMTVDLGCMKCVISREDGAIGISEGTTRDIALISRVGRPVSFCVTAIKTDKYGKLYAQLSRKKAQEICKNEFLKKLTAGDVINAKITHLESFGAFCDIGCGIAALLPINSISVSRISHPRDRFSPGEDIKAVVAGIAPDGKVTLSLKELLGTWEENAACFAQGETVSGIVRSVEPYGVFVELAPNLAGLAEPKSDVFIGQTASVFIKSIIPDKMKVKLIIIDSFDTKYSFEKKYFFEGDHIDRWEYSPPDSYKIIVSDFVAKK